MVRCFFILPHCLQSKQSPWNIIITDFWDTQTHTQFQCLWHIFRIIWDRAWERQKWIQTAFLLTDKQKWEVIHLTVCVWWILISKTMTQPRKHWIRSRTLSETERDQCGLLSQLLFLYLSSFDRKKEKMAWKNARMRHLRTCLNTGSYFRRSGRWRSACLRLKCAHW